MREASTPLMRQYQTIKRRYPHALLLFRLGDFYELFYEDAIVASRELQITLTSRNREHIGHPHVRRALSRRGDLSRPAVALRL
jgi:DNA mismatch repair ATPase MutS